MCPTSFVHADPGFFVHRHLTNERASCDGVIPVAHVQSMTWMCGSIALNVQSCIHLLANHREMTGQLNVGISALISLGVLISQVTKECPITLA